MISGWKKTAIANMASAFGGGSSAEPPISASDVEKLHAKIGQLVVEWDFLADASSLILGTTLFFRLRPMYAPWSPEGAAHFSFENKQETQGGEKHWCPGRHWNRWQLSDCDL